MNKLKSKEQQQQRLSRPNDHRLKAMEQTKQQIPQPTSAAEATITPLSKKYVPDAKTISPKDSLEVWASVRDAKDPKFTDVVLESVSLPCTLDAFHTLFLQDNAAHSIGSYQGKVIGDTELQISLWTLSEDSLSSSPSITTLARSIDYVHPVNAGPMAPPEAAATKSQTLRLFPDNRGLIVDTRTTVKGVPMADCFHVNDRLLVEPSPDGENVTVTAKFEVKFVKRTMFKKIVALTTGNEFTDFFKGYGNYLEDALNVPKKEEEGVFASIVAGIEEAGQAVENSMKEAGNAMENSFKEAGRAVEDGILAVGETVESGLVALGITEAKDNIPVDAAAAPIAEPFSAKQMQIDPSGREEEEVAAGVELAYTARHTSSHAPSSEFFQRLKDDVYVLPDGNTNTGRSFEHLGCSRLDGLGLALAVLTWEHRQNDHQSTRSPCLEVALFEDVADENDASSVVSNATQASTSEAKRVEKSVANANDRDGIVPIQAVANAAASDETEGRLNVATTKETTMKQRKRRWGKPLL